MSDQEDEGMEAEESPFRMILSLTFQNAKLGVSYFNNETGEMGWGETNEFQENSYQSLEFVKYKLKPSLIIVPSKQDLSFMNAVRIPVEDCPPFEVKTIKSQDYNFDSSKQKLFQLKRILDGSDDEEMEEPTPFQANYLWGLSSVDCNEYKQMIRAAGGLLCYIQTNRMQFGELNETEVLRVVKKIQFLSFEGFVQVDLNTIRSLSIFKAEKHPCQTMKIGVSKEGLSLFGVLNQTKSKVGKELLRQWFLQPLMDIDLLNERFDSIEYFVDINNRDLLKEVRDNIKFVKDTKRILKRIQEANATVEDWINLYKTLYCYSAIVDLFHQEPSTNGIPVVGKLYEHYSEEVINILSTLSKVIDFQESKSVNRVIIQPGVDDELDHLKTTLDGLDHLLELVAEEERRFFPDDIAVDMTVVYYPQIGYLIAVPLTKRLRDQGVDNMTDLEYHFTSKDMVYYKNERMYELDEKVGDVRTETVDLESAKLESFLLEYTATLATISEVLAELDCLTSLAVAAQDNQYTRPTVTRENVLVIKKGRNPLQEMTVNTFIPNGTSVEEAGRVNIITGPNNSGKSVYLKQVGLITFMAHIGSFVPAEEAVIGTTDRIMTRISSQDSISVNQSSFAVDLLQIHSMVTICTSKTLLLIDEFGKGTLALDGLALLASTIKHLMNQDECPKVFVSTHYTEMLEYKLIDTDSEKVQVWTMDVIVDEDDDLQDDIVYLYNLIPGKVTPSYGLACATMAGIPSEIVQRAKVVSNSLAKNQVVERLDNEGMKDKEAHYAQVVDKFKQLVSKDFTEQDAQAFMQQL